MGTISKHDSQTEIPLSGGVLSNMVQQPSDQSPSYSKDKLTCQLKFKGPYDKMKDINGIVGKPLSSAITDLPVNVSHNFDFPAAPANTKWWVTGTTLEQLEAGDHAIMTLTLDAKPNDYDPEQSGGAFDPYQDTWQLRWESYTVKPAAFCKNEPHEDKPLTAQTGSQEITGYADRQHVYYFTQAGKDNCGFAGQQQHYWYRTQDGDFMLNDAEQYILKKTLTDTNALYHYPVLMHHTTKNYYSRDISSAISSNTKYGTTIGDDIDHVLTGNVPPGCPYDFPSNTWTWIKTGDDMTHVKTKEKISFQRTETFMGVISADPNYYGNEAFNHSSLDTCRWKIGEV